MQFSSDIMRLSLDWAEEHWEAVGVIASIFFALIVAVALAVAFNVISTRHDDLHFDVVGVTPVTYPERSETSGGPGSRALVAMSR